MATAAAKIRALLFHISTPPYVFRANSHGPEWFEEQPRLLLLRHFNTPDTVRTRDAEIELAYDRTIWTPDGIYRFMACPFTRKGERRPQFESEEEILLVTDAEYHFMAQVPFAVSHMPVLRVGHRGLVTIDQIAEKVDRLEKQKEEKETSV